MKRRICFVAACPHRHEDGWEHVLPVRRTAPTAHLLRGATLGRAG